MFYKKMLKKSLVALFIGMTLTLFGCSNAMYNQTTANVADVAEKATDARHQSDESGKPQPSLVVNQGPYVDKTPISLAREPTWLRNHIIIRGDELPFAYYSRTIASGGGHYVLTRYQVGLDPSLKVSMNYSGSVKGALDLLAAKSGFIYNINGCNVYWQAFVTKTFDVAFMPGSSDYMMGKSGGGSGSVSTVGGSGQTVSAIMDDSAASQYSNLKGSLSVWKDLENSIKEILTPEGKVMVSEATTSVTVRDRPTNVALVSRFIANMNNTLSKQVLVKVQVLDILLSSAYDFGINWALVKKSLGTQFILNGNYGTPVSITPFVPTTQVGPLAGGAIAALPQFGGLSTGGSTGATALINSLTQQGKVSVVTEPRVVCLNNQVSVIRIVNQEGYLASVQNTTVAGAAGAGSAGTITSQITPGSITTGLTLYILPKIMGDKVFLQVNADLSSNNGFTSVSSITGGTPPTTSGNNSSGSGTSIQVPNLTQKQFNQRSVIGSGATLILSGFRQVSNTANAMQLFESQALGGKGAIQRNVETIVLITPIILHGSA